LILMGGQVCFCAPKRVIPFLLSFLSGLACPEAKIFPPHTVFLLPPPSNHFWDFAARQGASFSGVGARLRDHSFRHFPTKRKIPPSPHFLLQPVGTNRSPLWRPPEQFPFPILPFPFSDHPVSDFRPSLLPSLNPTPRSFFQKCDFPPPLGDPARVLPPPPLPAGKSLFSRLGLSPLLGDCSFLFRTSPPPGKTHCWPL